MKTSTQLAMPSQPGWAWLNDYIPGHWRFFGVCLICEGGPVAGDPAHWYVRCMRCGRAHFSEGDDGLPIEIAIAHLDRFPMVTDPVTMVNPPDTSPEEVEP